MKYILSFLVLLFVFSACTEEKKRVERENVDWEKRYAQSIKDDEDDDAFEYQRLKHELESGKKIVQHGYNYWRRGATTYTWPIEQDVLVGPLSIFATPAIYPHHDIISGKTFYLNTP